MGKKRSEGDVHWLLPGKKKPIAYSTLYASNLIVLLAREYDTIQEIHDAIIYDAEAKEIMRKYIDKGCGSAVARDMFK